MTLKLSVIFRECITKNCKSQKITFESHFFFHCFFIEIPEIEWKCQAAHSDTSTQAGVFSGSEFWKKIKGHSLNIIYTSYMLSTRLFKMYFHHLLSWCTSFGLCIVLKGEENYKHEVGVLSYHLILCICNTFCADCHSTVITS